MAFVGTSTTSIADYLQDKIVPNALGQLIGELDLLRDVPVIPFSLQERLGKNKTVRVPETGGLSAVIRPELDPVVDQALSTNKTDIAFTEAESTFVIDNQADDVMNEELFNLNIGDAIKAVSELIITNAYTTLGAAAGTTIGVANTPLVYDVFVDPKRLLTNSKVPKANRFYHVSPQTMEEIMNFTQYEGVFGFNGEKKNEEVAQLAGFVVRESVYLELLSPGIRNIAFQAQQVGQVFPPQKNETKAGMVKRTMAANGYSVSILVENAPGTNGGSRCTVSVNHGINAFRSGVGVINVDAT